LNDEFFVGLMVLPQQAKRQVIHVNHAMAKGRPGSSIGSA
jgi:hypothetical protein